MTFVTVRCPHCDSEQIVKRGKTRRGTQRYLCQNIACIMGSFLLDYRNRGCLPEVKQQIIDMSLNASGVRDTARSLHISPTTVLSALKKQEAGLESVNTALLRTLDPERVAIDIERAGEAEMDEMWSFVGNKGNPRWLWQQQGKQAEAHELLAPLYGWFIEGFDTADLQEAKTLLEELGG